MPHHVARVLKLAQIATAAAVFDGAMKNWMLKTLRIAVEGQDCEGVAPGMHKKAC